MKSSKGKLQVIVGPMFSGKTSELIRRLVRYRFAGYQVCIVFNAQDAARNATLPALRHLPTFEASTNLLPLAPTLIEKYDVIGIDEGHAFMDLVEFAEGASDVGKKVVVAALDGDAERSGFMNVLQLIPLAESVVKLNAVCMSCANEAPYTKIAPSQGESGVGGYMSVCQACYDRPIAVKRSPFKSQLKCTKFLRPAPRVPQLLMEIS